MSSADNDQNRDSAVEYAVVCERDDGRRLIYTDPSTYREAEKALRHLGPECPQGRHFIAERTVTRTPWEPMLGASS